MRPFAALDRHWFAPASLRALARLRILLVAAQLLLFLPPMARESLWLADPATEPSSFVALPALKLLLLPFGWGVRPSVQLVQAALCLAALTGLAALLGLYTRFSLLGFAAANTLVIAHAYSYGEGHHPEALMVLALWILAAAPAGAALSLDELRFRLRFARAAGRLSPTSVGEDRSPFARWPVRLIQWLFVLVYLSAGFSKLRIGGMEWLNGYTLMYYLASDGLARGAALGVWLSRHHLACAFVSLTSVLFELTFVLALVPRLTWLYLGAGAALHLGIYLTQRAPFFEYLFLYAVFAEPLVQGLRRDSRARAPWIVLYDGLCPLCTRTMVFLDQLSPVGRLRFLDLDRDRAEISGLAPGLDREAARGAFHVIDPKGSVQRGFFALRSIGRALPLLWPLLPILHGPLSRRVGQRAYVVVVRRGKHACAAEVDSCVRSNPGGS